jgi:hypothetical protein
MNVTRKSSHSSFFVPSNLPSLLWRSLCPDHQRCLTSKLTACRSHGFLVTHKFVQQSHGNMKGFKHFNFTKVSDSPADFYPMPSPPTFTIQFQSEDGTTVGPPTRVPKDIKSDGLERALRLILNLVPLFTHLSPKMTALDASFYVTNK